MGAACDYNSIILQTKVRCAPSKRCDLVLDEQDIRTKKRTERARKGGIARHLKEKENSAQSKLDTSGMLTVSELEALLESAQGKLDDSSNQLQDKTRQDKTKKERGEKNSPLYQFVAKTIRLTEQDYSRWKKVYHAIPDFDAELTRIDDSLATEDERKNWFVSTSAKLNFAHKKYLADPKAPPGKGPRPRQWSVAERVAKTAEWGMQNASPAAIRARVAQEGLSDVWGDS